MAETPNFLKPDFQKDSGKDAAAILAERQTAFIQAFAAIAVNPNLPSTDARVGAATALLDQVRSFNGATTSTTDDIDINKSLTDGFRALIEKGIPTPPGQMTDAHKDSLRMAGALFSNAAAYNAQTAGTDKDIDLSGAAVYLSHPQTLAAMKEAGGLIGTQAVVAMLRADLPFDPKVGAELVMTSFESRFTEGPDGTVIFKSGNTEVTMSAERAEHMKAGMTAMLEQRLQPGSDRVSGQDLIGLSGAGRGGDIEARALAWAKMPKAEFEAQLKTETYLRETAEGISSKYQDGPAESPISKESIAAVSGATFTINGGTQRRTDRLDPHEKGGVRTRASGGEQGAVAAMRGMVDVMQQLQGKGNLPQLQGDVPGANASARELDAYLEKNKDFLQQMETQGLIKGGRIQMDGVNAALGVGVKGEKGALGEPTVKETQAPGQVPSRALTDEDKSHVVLDEARATAAAKFLHDGKANHKEEVAALKAMGIELPPGTIVTKEMGERIAEYAKGGITREEVLKISKELIADTNGDGKADVVKDARGGFTRLDAGQIAGSIGDKLKEAGVIATGELKADTQLAPMAAAAETRQEQPQVGG